MKFEFAVSRRWALDPFEKHETTAIEMRELEIA